jgi:hypothetical protein
MADFKGEFSTSRYKSGFRGAGIAIWKPSQNIGRKVYAT